MCSCACVVSRGCYARHRSSREPSSTAMTAILIALEGLTKEVARVRVCTAQLGDRGHTSDVRLTYVEDQVSRIKNKMKQLKVHPTHKCSSNVCLWPSVWCFNVVRNSCGGGLLSGHWE